MMNAIVNSHRKHYLQISAIVFLFFFSWSASMILLSIWLAQEAGLDSTMIGLVYTANGLFTVLLKPVYGFILDRLGMRKNLLYFIVLASVCMAPFFIFVYKPLLQHFLMAGIILGGLFTSLAWYDGVAACESYADRFSRINHLEFGQIRMWGSLGWASSAALSGFLFNLDPNMIFIVGSVSSAVMFCILCFLKSRYNNEQLNQVTNPVALSVRQITGMLRHNPKFWLFCLYVSGVTGMIYVAEQQYARFFVSFFADHRRGNEMFGYVVTAQGALEFLMMFCVPFLINKIGAKNGMLLAGLVVAARLIITGTVGNIAIIAALKPLYGLEMALLLVSVFKYNAEHFDSRVNSMMYLLGYQGTIYLVSLVLATPAGYLYDHIGFGHTYILMGLCALVITAISVKTLSRCTNTQFSDIDQDGETERPNVITADVNGR
nr:oligosaccharide MFS transporter [Pantoea rwandensis]